ncbi:MAG: glycosyltransferase family 39 protein [Candidatus Promineifilaceae bacterium]|nr:glycosyltransferase family 39 protein [Candidatus Promineifilaceae bacterium]
MVPAERSSVESDHPSRLASTAPYLILILIMLLAYAVRTYALEGQSMWSDEGLSLYRARLSLVDLFKGLIIIDGIETRDTNPPFYFILLHLLRSLAGESIFALRYSGVLAGFLAVPLMYVIGKVGYERRVGIAAAGLMAISPFHVWQSQVLRNYSLLLLFNLFAVYGLLRFILANHKNGQRRWLVLWLICSLLGIYTHYFGFFIFAFGLLVLAMAVIWRGGRVSSLILQKRTWLILGGMLLLVLPAVVIALNRFNAGQQVDFHQVGLSQVFNHAASAFAVGIAPSLTHSWWLIWPALVLFMAGVLLGWRSGRTTTLILLAYQFVPLGLLLLLSIINPLYNGVRHLLIGLPPFLLIVAAGAFGSLKVNFETGSGGRGWQIWRRLRVVLALLLLLIQVGWLYAQFTDSRLIRDDIRGVAEYLNKHAAPDDLIVLHDTIIGLTFDYYYDGKAAVKAVPSLGEQDVLAAEAALQEFGSQADRVWFLIRPTPRTGFPRMILRHWADDNWSRFFNRSYPSMWLRVELNGYMPTLIVSDVPAESTALNRRFDDSLQLHGVQLPSRVRAGEPWWVTFYWSQLREDSAEYVLSIRFVDQYGRTWQQIDELLWHEYLDHQLPLESKLRKDYELTLATGLPPGEYAVWLRMLESERIPLAAEDGQLDHLLGSIRVETGGDIAQLPTHTAQHARLGEVEFLGYNLPGDEIRPGHGIPFELFWRVLQPPSEDYQVRIRLIAPSGQVAAESINAPAGDGYPMTQWQTSEILQSKFQMLMPGNIEIIPHYVQVALISPTSGEMIAAVTLKDKLSADPWPFVTEMPEELESVHAEIGDPAAVSLRGYDFPETVVDAGDALNFTLYWQAIEDVPESYFVFVHIMGQDGEMAAQYDGAPVQGFRPTMSWRAGEVIEDSYSIPLGSDIEPGIHQVWVGLYHPGSGQRAHVVVDEQHIEDNRILLREITIQQAE